MIEEKIFPFVDTCWLEGQSLGFHFLAPVFGIVGKLGLSHFGGIDRICLQLSLIAEFETGQHDHY